ncbi:hypothetical protein [Streptococcus dysgalactiae]|uniref:hypothetical protein n=1 Tax=Streptococcus dysgalactiae TaxID=1334 RepID=UPI0019504360|nr:hypothetical protein [Streptococcus dysgalactiae]MBM6549308.1 hypothetical protein [Streptococcus dysgalactiae subsp. equisimilis]
MQQQQKLIETLAEKLTLQATASIIADQSRPLVDAIAQTISEFQYDPNFGVYFDAWFRKYKDTFRVELAQADDAHKVRILLRKLGPAAYERYTNFILPKNPRKFSFDETVNYLSQIFGEQSSLFKIRYQFLKLVKNETDDFITYAGIVNLKSKRFKLRTMTDDQFKALIFVCGLQSPTDCIVLY